MQIEMFDLPPVAAEWEAPSPMERLMHITRTFGPIMTQSLLVKELGLSKQRISQLVNQGRFEIFTIEGEKWVTVRSVEEFRRTEKSLGGRPKKEAKAA